MRMENMQTSAAGVEAQGRGTPLEILIRTDGVELNERLRETVRWKIGRARHYAPGTLSARVQILRDSTSRSAKMYRAHVVYSMKGRDVSAQHRAGDPVTALDAVSQKIERRLRKRKTAALAQRVRDYRRKPLRKMDAFPNSSKR